MRSIVFCILCAIPCLGWSFDDVLWKMSLQGGYSAIGSVQAASSSNGFPLQIGLGANFSPQWSSKIEYQWINSEHTSGRDIHFHSFRILPRYRFFDHQRNSLGLDIGLGYQQVLMKNTDLVGQFEFLVGPTWNYQISDHWDLETNLRYAHSSTQLLSPALHRIDITCGVSIKFGNTSAPLPVAYIDSDQDGIVDQSDQCKNTAFGTKVSKEGCPRDGDGDLVADIHDYCPSTKRGVEVDTMGCPIKERGRGLIDGISFEKNSPRLTISAKEQLSLVAENLRQFPNIYFVIEGYTSSIPNKMDISKARATTVMNVLASYGVPSERMSAIGLSDMYPLIDSSLESEQTLNERIEIKWKHQL